MCVCAWYACVCACICMHVHVCMYMCLFMFVHVDVCSLGGNLVWGIWILSHTICKYFNLVSVFLWYMGAHSMIWLIFLQLVLFRYL